SGTDAVFIRPFPNVDDGRVPVGRGASPRWSPSGRELFYFDGQGPLVSVSFELAHEPKLGNPRRLLEAKYFIAGPAVAGRTYDVWKDGERFLMIKDSASSPQSVPSAGIVMELNWVDELKQLFERAQK